MQSSVALISFGEMRRKGKEEERKKGQGLHACMHAKDEPMKEKEKKAKPH
jgi:hypothetical protein